MPAIIDFFLLKLNFKKNKKGLILNCTVLVSNIHLSTFLKIRLQKKKELGDSFRLYVTTSPDLFSLLALFGFGLIVMLHHLKCSSGLYFYSQQASRDGPIGAELRFAPPVLPRLGL